jgi:hypothetical protein
MFCLTRGGRVDWIVGPVQIGADGNEPFADVMTITGRMNATISPIWI